MAGTINPTEWTGVYVENQIEQTSNAPLIVEARYYNICKEPISAAHSQEEHRLADYEAMGYFRYQPRQSRHLLQDTGSLSSPLLETNLLMVKHSACWKNQSTRLHKATTR